MLVWMILIPTLAPPEPPEPDYYVRVDFIVINRVLRISEEHDAWGRPKWKPSFSMVWISFWDRCRAVVIPSDKFIVGRGWRNISQVRGIHTSESGWLVYLADDICIVSPELWLMDSFKDFELANRSLYWPIEKPK